mmetsp:Transcript_20710/g.40260  ORF Transcript_20710/g.40260 Transcript_20710/m.40260 type:complete len:239 (+) Transcript_20710:559-1275(+)
MTAGHHDEERATKKAKWCEEAEQAPATCRPAVVEEVEDGAYDTEPWEDGIETPVAALQTGALGDKSRCVIDTVYCDLDGVLADFDKGFRSITGKAPESFTLRDMWSKIVACEWKEGFFGDLEFMDGGEELWDSLAHWGPRLKVLTGIPKGGEEWSTRQKRSWCARKLEGAVRGSGGLEVICCHSEEKKKWATPRAVLIDDRAATNGAEWVAAGGIFVHHVSLAQTMAELRRLGVVHGE